LSGWNKTPAQLAACLAQGWQILLPSEAEWERAARGSSTSSETERLYPWGNDAADPNRANYDETGIKTTTTVGCFPAGATPEGIEELSGNVWEWTRSRYLKYPYPSDEQSRDERETIQVEGVKRDDLFVRRGGAYYSGKQEMRAPLRGNYSAGSLNLVFGFRVVVCGAAPGS
jgi:formylglycine-generating enzyme required for sulfatase activity